MSDINILEVNDSITKSGRSYSGYMSIWNMTLCLKLGISIPKKETTQFGIRANIVLYLNNI